MPADASVPPRLAWADASRGFSVLAVVMFHVWLWYYKPAAPYAWPSAAKAWNHIDTLLGSVRIPLLLAVSAMVLAKRLLAADDEHKSVLRAVADYYLYVVWLAVYLVFYSVVGTPGLPHRVDGPLDALGQLVVPGTTLWYLFALAVYIAVFRLLRRVPPWIMLAATTVLCVAIRAVGDFEESFGPKVAESTVFFAVGLYSADYLRRSTARVTWWRVLAWIVAAAVVTVVGGRVPGEIGGSVVCIVRGVVFAFAGIQTITWAIRLVPLERMLVFVGRRTLAVYVLHPLLIAVAITATRHWAGFHAALAEPAIGTLYPAAVLIVVVALALAIDWTLRQLRANAVLTMPAPLRRVVTRGLGAWDGRRGYRGSLPQE